MEKSINPDFSGNLIIWDIPCTFSFSKGYSLLIKPFESEKDTFIQKCKEFNGNFNGLDWIHGKSIFEGIFLQLGKNRKRKLMNFAH